MHGEFQGRRRALLIGVTATPFLSDDPLLNKEFATLECAERDVGLLSAALELSGYAITEHHAGRVSELKLGQNGLKGELHRFFVSCEPGDTAFVYVSCHGVTLGGRDFLLAADAQPGDPRADGTPTLLTDSLLGADPVGLQLRGLKKGVTAVICLDTCRTADLLPGEEVSTGVRAPAQDVVWLYSCGPGQRAYADRENGSWFAQGLAQALAPDSPPTTFGDIMRHTEQEMRRLAGDEQVDPPTVKHLAPHGRLVDTLELCKGFKEPLPWAEMVTKSALWEHTSGGDAVHARVKAGLTELVERVGRNLRGAGAHKSNPWRDPTYPARFERRLVGLVERARLKELQALLSPAETAVLLAAPLVYEDITAVALEDLRQVLDRRRPDEAKPDEHLDEHGKLVVAAVEDVRRAHKQVQGTLETLRARGLAPQAEAAEHWLRHRFIADWDPLWERTGGYESVNILMSGLARVIARSAEPLPPGRASEQSLRLIDRQIRQVLGHLTVEPGDRPRINDSDSDSWSRYDPVPGGKWRGQELAQLLWTAGLLSADPRRMSSVLVNHLGAHERLDPQTVVDALSEEFDFAVVGDLTADRYGLDVRFHCPHPALHAAVEELAGRANAAVAAIRSRWREQRSSPPSLLRGLPERVTAGQLVPESGQYTVPLERFRLAEDEIRPLLMGAQLYGDKMLAVRELYQNALDACRLRDMRDQYGRSQGEGTEGWEGKIAFTQGWDEKGRLYIQCEDNGTGMSRAKLTSMFARAGKRYEQDPEFMQERREWRRAGLKPIALNSRFGIGVFSYFMLAEEVVVVTAPVDRYGLRESLDQASRADIQSGSGLLSITPGKGVPAQGGTRVRLYLALAKEEQPPSLVETLQSQLWVSDYAVTAVEYAQDEPEREVRSREWKPGRLKAVANWRGPAVHADGTDVWLVQGEGQLLLDGVVIEDAPRAYGCVVNLRERHRPVPSVDRNDLLSYDEDAVQKEVLAAAPKAAAQWKEVSLRRLWQLAQEGPPLAVAVLDALPAGVTATLEPAGNDVRLLRGRMQLGPTGCLPMDHRIVSDAHDMTLLGKDRAYENNLFRQWRMARLEHAPLADHEFSPPEYPVATGLDSLLFVDTPSPEWAWAPVLKAAALARLPVRAAVKALRRYAITGVYVPSVTDIRSQLALELPPAAADLYIAYRDLLRSAGDRVAAHAPLLLISDEYNLPLGECLPLLGRLQELDPGLPPLPELGESLAAERFTYEEARVLAGDKGSEWLPSTRWHNGAMSITHLKGRVETSFVDSSLDAAELLARVRRLAPLGFSVWEEAEAAPGDRGSLTAAEHLLLMVRTDVGNPWVDKRLTLRQVLLASSRREISLGEAARLFAEASAVTAIRAPAVPAEAAAWTPPYWVVRVVEQWRKPRKAFGPWELINAYLYQYSKQTPRAIAEFREAVTALDACGLLTTDPSWDHESLIRQATAPPLDSVTYGYTGSALDTAPVSSAFCLSLVRSGTGTLGEVLDRLEAAEKHLPLHLPDMTAEARSLHCGAYDRHALLDGRTGTGEAPEFRSLTIQDLLEHADDSGGTLSQSVHSLSRFTAIGAPPLPGDFTGPDAEALTDFEPNRFDLAAFDPGLLGPGTLGPLELVLVAGRFGWTLKRTYDRYAPFRCLGLNVEVSEPTRHEADMTPTWYDVVILTEQLTGRTPALSGTVTADHIALCAEETDLPEAEVRERLGRYSALFRLQLPPEEGQEAS
ncbi:caspase family protein [Streptomyces sp. NBC_00878]|uniref:HD domain-containing protein n=1 Tax=Streptomyces sp. NBC_00878 TaxID=2975854 RepID=UPI00225019B7|nr:caspase family protein [Streptomyces sp. NBC_00878]MCX4909488.1 caspase family protein [Streptomyces sp. NBC_00878]